MNRIRRIMLFMAYMTERCNWESKASIKFAWYLSGIGLHDHVCD